MEDRPHSLKRFFNYLGTGFFILCLRTKVIPNVSVENFITLGNTFAFIFPQAILLASILMLVEDFYLYIKDKYFKK